MRRQLGDRGLGQVGDQLGCRDRLDLVAATPRASRPSSPAGATTTRRSKLFARWRSWTARNAMRELPLLLAVGVRRAFHGMPPAADGVRSCVPADRCRARGSGGSSASSAMSCTTVRPVPLPLLSNTRARRRRQSAPRYGSVSSLLPLLREIRFCLRHAPWREGATVRERKCPGASASGCEPGTSDPRARQPARRTAPPASAPTPATRSLARRAFRAPRRPDRDSGPASLFSR